MHSIPVKKEEEIKSINAVCLFNFCVPYFKKKICIELNATLIFLLNQIFALIKCIEIDVLALVEFRQYYLLLLKEIKTINCKIVTDPHPLLPSFSCLKIRDIQYDNFPTSNSHFSMSYSVEMEFNNNLIIISLRMHIKFSIVLCSYLIF